MTRRVGRTLRLSVPPFTVGGLAVVAALGWKIGPPGASGPKGGVCAPLPCGRCPQRVENNAGRDRGEWVRCASLKPGRYRRGPGRESEIRRRHIPAAQDCPGCGGGGGTAGG